MSACLSVNLYMPLCLSVCLSVPFSLSLSIYLFFRFTLFCNTFSSFSPSFFPPHFLRHTSLPYPQSALSAVCLSVYPFLSVTANQSSPPLNTFLENVFLPHPIPSLSLTFSNTAPSHALPRLITRRSLPHQIREEQAPHA